MGRTALVLKASVWDAKGRCRCMHVGTTWIYLQALLSTRHVGLQDRKSGSQRVSMQDPPIVRVLNPFLVLVCPNSIPWFQGGSRPNSRKDPGQNPAWGLNSQCSSRFLKKKEPCRWIGVEIRQKKESGFSIRNFSWLHMKIFRLTPLPQPLKNAHSGMAHSPPPPVAPNLSNQL